MSGPEGGLAGVVLAHGNLASAMVQAAEEITGVRGVLTPVSNSDCDRSRLEDRLRQAIAPGPTLVFVDLPSGSCFFAAMRTLATLPNVQVVTGVNLSMLLEFIFHRDETVADAAARAGDQGVRAIRGAHDRPRAD